MIKLVKSGGVTSAKGYQATGLSCGIKRSGKPDLTLIASDVLATAVGVFTKNSIKAAPLLVSKKHLKNSKAKAIIVNSGNANCYTGDIGHIYAQRMAQCTAKYLKINPYDVLVASTGIIGKALPINKIRHAIPLAVKELKKGNGHKAAKGILTTDLKTKEIAVKIIIDGKPVIIGGCAKGSGMIEPNMATMLAFITTDCCIETRLLRGALKSVVDETFNCISVDGCMSTNDMVTIMANGLAENKCIKTANKQFKQFVQALKTVCLFLAKEIVLDGEGATKFISITVSGAKTPKQAKTAAMKVANSALVKTAAYGQNPNWGRVAAAIGSLGLAVTEKTLEISFSSFQKKDIKISADLHLGKFESTVFTCDLSHKYIDINGKYN